jgi:hypothetical protein
MFSEAASPPKGRDLFPETQPFPWSGKNYRFLPMDLSQVLVRFLTYDFRDENPNFLGMALHWSMGGQLASKTAHQPNHFLNGYAASGCGR